MSTPTEIENLRPVFQRVLQTHQMSTRDVRIDFSCWAVSDRGAFQCAKCTRFWRSNFSWVTFNLKELQITYRWKMKCVLCYIDCIPTFTVEQLETMFGKAVKFYKGDRSSAVMTFAPRRTSRRPEMPHRPDLCEMCNTWGEEHCWFRQYYTIR